MPALFGFLCLFQLCSFSLYQPASPFLFRERQMKLLSSASC
ncbi:hypothetical protein CLOM621_08207 [Clostridium sp. M62/1]|nr:hypothetical protein CLOM621_08207 [Clostridium sp. M62/1]